MLLNKFLVEKIEYIYNALVITNWRKEEGIMVKYCPSCGVEVKEGFKFCLGCGAQLQADTAAQPAQGTTSSPACTTTATYTATCCTSAGLCAYATAEVKYEVDWCDYSCCCDSCCIGGCSPNVCWRS